MWTLHTANPDHWVPLSTVASFKRMREFQSLGNEWLVTALKTVSTELELDDTNTNVRRTTEVTEPKGQFERSIYAVRVTLPPINNVFHRVLERFWGGRTRSPAKNRRLLQPIR